MRSLEEGRFLGHGMHCQIAMGESKYMIELIIYEFLSTSMNHYFLLYPVFARGSVKLFSASKPYCKCFSNISITKGNVGLELLFPLMCFQHKSLFLGLLATLPFLSLMTGVCTHLCSPLFLSLVFSPTSAPIFFTSC